MTYPLPCPAIFKKTRAYMARQRWTFALCISIGLLHASSAHALSLALPIDCTLGKDCFIQNYPDHDSKDAFQDYQCGTTLGYSGHTGTDFRLVDEAAMHKGVNVLASAAGKVIGLRNDMPDLTLSKNTPEAIKGKECGNGMIIEHPDGWKTQYCHLKQHSVTVKPGEEVKEGHILGQVGLSGNTDFPHVHLSVTDPKEQRIDPFTGTPLAHPCSPTSKLPNTTLWKANTHTSLAYTRGGILNAGFSTRALSYDEVKRGEALSTTAPTSSPLLTYMGYYYGLEKGDEVKLTLTAPDGELLAQITDTLDKNQASFYRIIGSTRYKGAWKTGTYYGTTSVLRGGKLMMTSSHTLTVKKAR